MERVRQPSEASLDASGDPAAEPPTIDAHVVAEAEGFEPSMGLKPQTALAVRRHRPD